MNDWDAYAGLALPVGAGSLLAVAALGRPPERHARVTREGGTAFLGERVMHRGYAWVEALAGFAVRLGLGADAVSWSSLALGLAAGVLAAQGWLGSAAWALALSGLADGVDGAVARRRGTAGAAGAVLDSALDRYVEFFFSAGLLCHFRQPAAQLLVLTALCGGFMVTYSTAKAEALRLTPPRGWMKRPERLVWLTAGAALAAAAPLAGIAGTPVMLGALGVIAVFAHAGAILRLRALGAAARRR